MYTTTAIISVMAVTGCPHVILSDQNHGMSCPHRHTSVTSPLWLPWWTLDICPTPVRVHLYLLCLHRQYGSFSNVLLHVFYMFSVVLLAPSFWQFFLSYSILHCQSFYKDVSTMHRFFSTQAVYVCISYVRLFFTFCFQWPMTGRNKYEPVQCGSTGSGPIPTPFPYNYFVSYIILLGILLSKLLTERRNIRIKKLSPLIKKVHAETC
jgi:hypothetical protein